MKSGVNLKDPPRSLHTGASKRWPSKSQSATSIPDIALKYCEWFGTKRPWQANYLHIGSPLTKVSGEAVESFTNHPRLDCQANNPENADINEIRIWRNDRYELGKPSCKKSAVFLNIVQKAFDPPPFIWTFVLFCRGCFFKKRFCREWKFDIMYLFHPQISPSMPQKSLFMQISCC